MIIHVDFKPCKIRVSTNFKGFIVYKRIELIKCTLLIHKNLTKKDAKTYHNKFSC